MNVANTSSSYAWGAVPPTTSHRHPYEAARREPDVASVRGVGLSLIGLAATEAVEHRPERAVQIAAAADVYAHEEGIVNVYSDETPGREFIDQARAALSAHDVAHATEVGLQLDQRTAGDLDTNADRPEHPSRRPVPSPSAVDPHTSQNSNVTVAGDLLAPSQPNDSHYRAPSGGQRPERSSPHDSQPSPSPSPSNPCGSGGSTVKFTCGATSAQSRSGGGGGMQKSG
jgi:hypothetical protein